MYSTSSQVVSLHSCSVRTHHLVVLEMLMIHLLEHSLQLLKDQRGGFVQ